jgi:hypothetical protein
MKVSNVKGLANHNGPESCVAWSNPLGEALTGESAGWVLSREMYLVWDADPIACPSPTVKIAVCVPMGHFLPLLDSQVCTTALFQSCAYTYE